MKLNLVAFGIAKDILKANELAIEVENVNDIKSLKDELTNRFSGFSELRHFSLAVNEEYQEDSFQLSHNDEVVIIPPVSGG